MGSRAACVGRWFYLMFPLLPPPPEVLLHQVQGHALVPHVSPGAALGDFASLMETQPMEVLAVGEDKDVLGSYGCSGDWPH